MIILNRARSRGRSSANARCFSTTITPGYRSGPLDLRVLEHSQQFPLAHRRSRPSILLFPPRQPLPAVSRNEDRVCVRVVLAGDLLVSERPLLPDRHSHEGIPIEGMNPRGSAARGG